MEIRKSVRIALYIRVSTVEQTEGFGFDMQEKNLMEHVDRNGYKGWHTKPQWMFVEQGSGANSQRRELKRLMEAGKKKEFDLVLVWKIDRISRSLTDLLEIFDRLNGYGVGFASLKEDIDFTGPIGKLIFQIFGALAEFERETIKMRTQEGKRMSALAGNFIGGSIPFGYKKVKNKVGKGSKLELIPREAEVMKSVFAWYVHDKLSLSEIADKLNKAGISKGESTRSTGKNTKWTDNSIRDKITNDIYRGMYITNRYKIISKKPRKCVERSKEQWTITNVPSVVSHIVFMQANERLKHGSKAMRGGGIEPYMLAGKLVDVETGKGFVGYKSGRGTKNYRRKKFTDKEAGKVYKTMSIAASELEATVWGMVSKALNQPKLFLEIHKQKSDNFRKQEALEARHEFYRKALTKTNKRIERVDARFYDGGIEEEEMSELIEKYKAERDENALALDLVDKELLALSQYDTACKDLMAFSERMEQNIEEFSYMVKKDLVALLVERVEIHDTEHERKATVFYRFDQRAISEAMPSGRTSLNLIKQPKTAEIDVNGQLQRQGYYLFEFETVLALKRAGRQDFVGRNQYMCKPEPYSGVVLEG